MHGHQHQRREDHPTDSRSFRGVTDDGHRSYVAAPPRQYVQAVQTMGYAAPVRRHEYQSSDFVMSSMPNSMSYHPRTQHAPILTNYDQPSYPENTPNLTNNGTSSAEAKLQLRRRRAKSLLILAGVTFIAMIFLDGVIQLTFPARMESVDPSSSVQKATLTSHAAPDAMGKPVNGYAAVDGEPLVAPASPENGMVRNLVGASSDGAVEETTDGQSQMVSINSINNYQNLEPLQVNSNRNKFINEIQNRRHALHRLPLLPKHTLQTRQRRELYHAQKPLPLHLREGQEDEMFHAEPHQRRRMYAMSYTENGIDFIVDARTHRARQNGRRGRRAQEEEAMSESTLYEIGSLYQGYGTHYIDLWVGTPPQRQTVIVDTGSSVTAFPCTGCESCGTDPATGVVYHLDPDYDKSASSTFREAQCSTGNEGVENTPCNIGTCSRVDQYDSSSPQYCKLAVAYAEGSSWTAAEGSDVVYPSGLHDAALKAEELEENGIGVGMGEIAGGKPFEWPDFRLGFGCQTKVQGLFRSQLEDGIMGMDNRKGAFWLQLHEHYKNSGHVQDENDPFDPAQFSLCYDRQPLSADLESGVGSGSLTLGGTDSLLHGTPMVFADNITPSNGWYTIHIKGMYLRTKGGTLAKLDPNADEISYIRVDAEENTLNGTPSPGSGPIVDSGTTDTYLCALLREPFNDAWKKALQNPGATFNNDPISLTPEQMKALPTIMIVLQGHASNTVQADGTQAVGMASHPNHASILQSSPDDTKPNIVSPTDIIVAIPPEHYMEESTREPGKFIARIYFTERFGDRSILGSNFIMGHEVLFDNTNGRIGFAESHCDYERYMEEKLAFLQALADAKSELEAPAAPADAPAPVDQGALDAEATANVQANDTPGQGDAPAPQGADLGENALAASGWSRKTDETRVLRYEVRIPG